jgi:tryptophan synthase alpha chain
MTAISDRFSQLRSRNECALIPFITAGDPDLATTEQALYALDQNGADFIELGIPYSDPLADGPVIQAASTRALAKGTQLDDVLALVTRVSPTIQAPIIFFTYYNPILNRGLDTFLDQLVAAGAKGLLVPDLPLEESGPMLAAAAARDLDLILLVAPTSSVDRIKAITAQSQGFVYLVSVTGVTGVRQSVQHNVSELLDLLRPITDQPIGVGFGIAQPDQAKQVRDWGADAVIVGSACVTRLADPDQGVPALAEFCRALKDAIR